MDNSGACALKAGRRGKSKAPQKTKHYLALFGLPDGEELLHDYSCAIKEQVLWHGRLYLSCNYVCFYSKIFMHVVKIKIPRHHIVKVQREKLMGLWPTSMQITTEDGKSYFFASFMTSGKRNKAVREIQLMAGLLDCQKRRSSESSASAENSAAEEDDDDDDDEEDDSGDEDGQDLQANLEFGEHRPPKYDASEVDTIKEVVDETFDISVDDFFSQFIHDAAPFSLLHFQSQRGDTETQISSWKSVPGSNKNQRVRDFSFRSKVENNMGMGPPTTRLHKVQQYTYELNTQLLLETVTMVPDIPFGDCLTIMDEWKVTPAGEGKCRLQVKVGIQFIKVTWKMRPLKGTIASRTIADNKKSVLDWCRMAKEFLANPGSSSKSRPSRRSNAGKTKGRIKKKDGAGKEKPSAATAAAEVKAEDLEPKRAPVISKSEDFVALAMLALGLFCMAVPGSTFMGIGYALVLLWFSRMQIRSLGQLRSMTQQHVGLQCQLAVMRLDVEAAIAAVQENSLALNRSSSTRGGSFNRVNSMSMNRRGQAMAPTPLAKQTSHLNVFEANNVHSGRGATQPHFTYRTFSPAKSTPRSLVSPLSATRSVSNGRSRGLSLGSEAIGEHRHHRSRGSMGNMGDLPSDMIQGAGAGGVDTYDQAVEMQKAVVQRAMDRRLNAHEAETQFNKLLLERIQHNPANAAVHLNVRQDYIKIAGVSPSNESTESGTGHSPDSQTRGIPPQLVEPTGKAATLLGHSPNGRTRRVSSRTHRNRSGLNSRNRSAQVSPEPVLQKPHTHPPAVSV